MNQPTESIEIINQRLADFFGQFEGQPHWRVVFSDDQFEKRLGTFNDYSKEGIFLRQKTEVRLVPKYRQWIQHKWVLERYTAVPEQCQDEILTRLSYEPIWVFEDKAGNPLPPIWLAIEYLIQHVYGVQGKKRPIVSDEKTDYEKRVNDLQEQLFGNETAVTDSLAYKDGVFIDGRNQLANMDVKRSTDDESTS